MPATQPTYGDCQIAVQARLAGDQPVRVQGVTAVASRTGKEHLSILVGRLLLYLEDRAALDALTDAINRANALADGVYGPVHDASRGWRLGNMPSSPRLAGSQAGDLVRWAARRRVAHRAYQVDVRPLPLTPPAPRMQHLPAALGKPLTLRPLTDTEGACPAGGMVRRRSSLAFPPPLPGCRSAAPYAASSGGHRHDAESAPRSVPGVLLASWTLTSGRTR